MKRFKQKTAALRSVGVVAAVVIIVSGVTFAILQSQQDTLTGNIIETASANLRLSTNNVDFNDSQPGFGFMNIVPGGPAVPVNGFPFYLRNDGSTPVTLKVGVSTPPSNPGNVDLSKVNILIMRLAAGAGVQSFTLQSLIDASANGGLPMNGGNLTNGISQEFRLQVSMAADAVNNTGAGLEGLDLSFTGEAVGN